jgi:alkylation response protein AidB-like acyl-CoA dehydrogenase
MDFSYDEGQEALRELARKILGDLTSPERLREVEKGGEFFDRTLWAELAKANLLGVAIAEEHGGSGYGLQELCLLFQEQGRAVAPIPLHSTLTAALALGRFGSDAQKRRWLPAVAAGDAVLACALDEDGVDDATRPVTTARADGARFRLEGRKVAVAAVGAAERMLVTADAGVFLVDPRSGGVRYEKQIATNREPVWWVELDGAEGEALLGADAAWLVDRALAGLCAIQLGVSERALEMTAEYGRTRRQFDRPIGSFQAFHQRAGDAYVKLEAMRLTLWQAAFQLERGEDAAAAVAIAKFWACEGGQFVGYAAQHLHGGIGVDVDYPLHRYYLWAKRLELSLGSGQRALARLGEAVARLT